MTKVHERIDKFQSDVEITKDSAKKSKECLIESTKLI